MKGRTTCVIQERQRRGLNTTLALHDVGAHDRGNGQSHHHSHRGTANTHGATDIVIPRTLICAKQESQSASLLNSCSLDLAKRRNVYETYSSHRCFLDQEQSLSRRNLRCLHSASLRGSSRVSVMLMFLMMWEQQLSANKVSRRLVRTRKDTNIHDGCVRDCSILRSRQLKIHWIRHDQAKDFDRTH